MPSVFLAPDPFQGQFRIPVSDVPANGGQLFFYSNKSSTKLTVYKDSAGTSAHTNPIVLNSDGNVPNNSEIWFQAGQTYTCKFCPSTDTDPPASPYWTRDDLSGINDVAAQTGSEWITGPTPTFVSSTQFSLSGDQTGTFTLGRRLKTTNTGGTVYSVITSVSFSANTTTVNVANDGAGALDSGMSAVYYSIADPANPSISPAEVNRRGANVASAGNGTTNIWGTVGDYVHVTGTNTIAFFSTAPYAGAMRDLVFDGVLSLNSSAAMLLEGNVTTAANDRAHVRADTVSTYSISIRRATGAPTPAALGNGLQAVSSLSLNVSTMTNSLAADVNMSNTANFFDGPSVAQGTNGVWWASGTVTMNDPANQGNYLAKLWDGTTVIASAQTRDAGLNNRVALALSGMIVSPAGNLRISVKEANFSTGAIVFNSTGASKDSTISVMRIG